MTKKVNVLGFVVPKLSMLELTNKKVGPRIRILRETSSLEAAPKVCNPKSSSENEEMYISHMFVY